MPRIIYFPLRLCKGKILREMKNHPADDWERPYLRDGVGGLPIEKQAEMLRAAGVDLGGENMDRAFVDRLSKNAIRKRERKSLKQREYLLEPTTRTSTEIICLASLRVLGWNMLDIANCILDAAERRARIHCLDTGVIYSAEMSGMELLQALVLADEASARNRAKNMQGGTGAAAAAKRRRTNAKLGRASELWARPSTEITVAEISKEVGLSPGTLYKALGRREVARDAKKRGKPHA